MEKNEHKNLIWRRCVLLYFVFCLILVFIFLRTYRIQNGERDRWIALSDSLRGVNEVKEIQPMRGNIYADDEQLLAASIPSYRLYFDFQTPALRENNGSLFEDNLDSLCVCLSRKLGDRSVLGYKTYLRKGYNSRSRYYKITNLQISHVDYKEICEFPLLRLNKYQSGFIAEKKIKRIKPFGSMAAVTIGRFSTENNTALYGIERAFDESLKGKPGEGKIRRAAGVPILEAGVPAVNGSDIVTTLNVNIQDICEKALRKKLISLQAESGCVLLMEVKTGQIKACVNLKKIGEGDVYDEVESIALRSQMEPGSTFKVPALMAAMEDGTIKETDSVDCGNGIWQINEKTTISDYNTGEKANHVIPVGQVIVRSSNVGIGKLIYENYGTKKEAIHFIEKLKEMGIVEPIDLGFKGVARAEILGPNDRSNWNYTDIASISFGYSVNIPLLYTLRFYNAIANDGKMMQPYFVKEIRNGSVVQKTYTPKVVKSSICSQKTLNTIKNMMLQVVEDSLHGTARPVKSKYVRIAGKTGTARYNYGRKDVFYKHQVSFCGFFPYEAPRYSCIVYMRNPQIGAASGGGMAGTVFKEIAERVMASMSYLPIEMYKKENFGKRYPTIGVGNQSEMEVLLNYFKVDTKIDEKSFWTKAYVDTLENMVELRPYKPEKNKMPMLKGLGLKDALYMIERCGMKAIVVGRGKVQRQIPEEGTIVKKGATVKIYLK